MHTRKFPFISYSSLSKPTAPRDKAVAFGAISYYLNHFVDHRLVKYTFGTIAWTTFDASNPEHCQRSARKKLGPIGKFVLEVFAPILFKVSNAQLLSPLI